MLDRYEFKVVGMTFLHELPHGAEYPGDFLRLRDSLEAAKAESLGWAETPVTPLADGSDPRVLHPEKVLLFRNPENPHDANAIEVHLPSLGRRSMIGHVPRDLAAQLAPSLDSGDKWDAVLDFILVEPGHEDNPGAQITVALAA